MWRYKVQNPIRMGLRGHSVMHMHQRGEKPQNAMLDAMVYSSPASVVVVQAVSCSALVALLDVQKCELRSHGSLPWEQQTRSELRRPKNPARKCFRTYIFVVLQELNVMGRQTIPLIDEHWYSL